MTTTALFPLHNHSFGESDPYAQAISAMSAGNGHFLNHFNTTETPESTNYDIRALQQQNPGQTPPLYDWKSTSWSIAQQSTQPVLASQPHTNPSPITTANVNPIALSVPVFTSTNQPTGYYDSPSSTSPSKSRFDTSSSASPASQDMYSRRDSLYPREDDTPSQPPITTPTLSTITAPTTTRRRRNMEYVEPGSARAIYLEKNRRAASKCRSKQKYEQEQLVERSRLFERKNRLLKAERDLLQAEVRALKDLLGQHTNCPDQRIAQYLQRAASRLASTNEFHVHF
jgi:cyclic AMP-dependent transcription factor ATF-2